VEQDMMAIENVWIELCMKHADLVNELLSVPSDINLKPYILTDATQVFVSSVSLLNRAHKRMLIHAAESHLFDATATGHQLFSLIHRAMTSGRILQKHIDTVKDSAAVDLDPGGEVRRAINTLEDLLKVHAVGWPWKEMPTWEEAIAAHDRGETLDLDEAFAEISGVTREEWLERVEAQKRLRHNAG
jgi:hypothetical protein